MGFSHADPVFVVGDANCPPSTIQPKKKGERSVMLQHAAVRVPIFRRLIDDLFFFLEYRTYGPRLTKSTENRNAIFFFSS